MIFALILFQNGAVVMKLDILAAFNTNLRRLIRIWRSWGLVDAKKRKQGWVCAFCFGEDKVVVQNQKIVILHDFCVNLIPERCRGNQI